MPAQTMAAPATTAPETPAQETTEETDETTQLAELVKQVAAMQTAIDALKALCATMQANMSEQAATDEKMTAQFSAQFQELNAALKVIAKIPVEDSRTIKTNASIDDKEQRLKDLAFILHGK